ncbi:MAG: prepilin peptidase [Proteobacteria bacterium]|nr:prepilin peptidase [Pseudomonadota bacterium]
MEQFLGAIFAIISGAIFGSYATLFAYRLPIGESCFGRYFGQKSRCPECHTIIRTRELIPLLNWIFTLGRCRSCKTRIPRTHLFVEVATTILFLLCYIKFSLSQEFMIYSMISVGCVILAATDFTHKNFPQQVLNFILMIGLANRVLQDLNVIDATFSAAIGIVFAAIFYQIFYKKTQGLFASQTQSFDYTKFILIASVCLKMQLFFFYFFAVMLIFTILIIFDIPTRKNRSNFGYSLIIPFLWLMLFPPLHI